MFHPNVSSLFPLPLLLILLVAYGQFAATRNLTPQQQHQEQQQQHQQHQINRPKNVPISATFQPPASPSSRNQPTVITTSTSSSTNPNTNHHHHHQLHQQQPLNHHRHHQVGPISAQSEQQLNRVGHQGSSRLPYQQQQQPHQNSICHHQHGQVSKCRDNQEADFKRIALAEFQSKLDETSLELRQLLTSYWDEFRTLSLDLVLVAKNNTLSRLQQQHSIAARQSTSQFDGLTHYEPTKNLFNSIYSHLSSYESSPITYDSLDAVQQPPVPSRRLERGQQQQAQPQLALNSVADINQEIAAYFRRLYLVQVKRLLDAKLTPNSWLDSECLDLNLRSQQQIDSILAELTNSAGQLNQQDSSATTSPPPSTTTSQLSLEQMKLTQSIKQSLEFARTLLSSLTLANGMFHNLTHRAADWMPHTSCHEALARMTVCQQCHPRDRVQFASGATAQSAEQSLAYVQAPPCESYCLNVVRGCMNDVYELNRFWANHVNALSRFKTNMIQMNNIETVMSNLDEKLIQFMTRLHQQYNSSSSQSSNPPQVTSEQFGLISAQLSKQCLRTATHSPGAGFRTAAGLELARLTGRPAALVLPPTQHPPGSSGALDRYGLMALRARLSPSMSLFNRLDGFVHQLLLTKDFFAEWPQRLCHKIRRQESNGNNNNANNGNNKANTSGLPARNNNNNNSSNSSSSDHACWNGRDFNGYTRAQVQFGQTITSMHPEVPISQPESYNTMVLNFVAKLKEIGAQLARKATRSPSYSLYHSLGSVDAALTSLVHGNNNNNNHHLKPSATGAGGVQQQQQQATQEAPGSMIKPSPSRNTVGGDQQVVLSAQGTQFGSAGLDLLAAASSSEHNDALEEDEEEPRADESSNDESLADGNNEDEPETEDDQGDDGSDGAGGTEPAFNCKDKDCSDLWDDNGSAGQNGNGNAGNQIQNSIVGPDNGLAKVPNHHDNTRLPPGIQLDLGSEAETVMVTTSSRLPTSSRGQFPASPSRPYSVGPNMNLGGPDSSAGIIPISNDLDPDHPAEYVERQAQSSTSSHLLLSVSLLLCLGTISLLASIWLAPWPIWRKQTSSV